MERLSEFITTHTVRGACRCGRCCDAPENPAERQPNGHTVDVHFFEVALTDPDANRDSLGAEFRSLLEVDYPQPERLAEGPSYIEMGAALGDQGLALMAIGLGELLGLWQAMTPAKMGISDPAMAAELAGRGMVMCTGLH